MEFRDLGPLQVDREGIAFALSGRRLESVLAVLVANVGEVVTVDALVDAVWGQAAFGRAPQSLESLVWRLRKVLEPDRVARQAASVLQTESRGYRLAVPAQAVDSQCLMRAVQTVPELLQAGEVTRALDTVDAILARWRGQPYLGVPDAEWMAPVRGQLEEAHLALQQHRVQALLHSAQPERALRELGPLLAAHPHREQLWAQRMLALYRCGRQSEALAAFAEARAALAGELGVDPGPDLRDLHQQILSQDRRLDPPTGDTNQPVRLPRRRTELVGRATELSRLHAELREHPLVTLIGPGGSGKTRLAVEAAHRSRPDYPDGVWFADLSDVADAGVVWTRVALTLGLASQPDRTVEQVTSAFLADRTVLLVLDNCEQILDGVRAATDGILDSCPRVTILATSREPLDLADEHVLALPPLPIPRAHDDLAANPAARLFLQRIGTAPSDVDEPGRVAIARICAAVDGLPLGLELAAARARSFELAEVAASLEADPIGLVRPGRGPTRQRTLYDTVDWSYRLARPHEQVLHRRLSAVSGPVTLEAAQAICSVPPLRPAQAMDLLAGLVHRSLLTHHRPERAEQPSRFTQHVLVRAHAGTSLAEAGETAAVGAARDRWVIEHVLAAPSDGHPDLAHWYAWLDANHAAVNATLAAAPTESGARIAETLLTYWYSRGLLIDGMRWLAAACGAADLEPFDRACAQAAHGCALAFNLEPHAALRHLRDPIPVLGAAAEPQLRRAGELLVRISAAAWSADLWNEAESAARAAMDIGERIDDPDLRLRARAVLSCCTLIIGDTGKAIDDANAVLEENRAVGNDFAAFFACVTNGVAAVFTEDPDAGLHWTSEAMRHQRALGIHNVGDTLEQRASHYARAGRHDVAVRCYGASAAQSDREGLPWPHHPGTAATLQHLRAVLSQVEYDRNWASGQRLGRETHDELPDEWG